MVALTNTKYEGDSGRIHAIALTPAYAAVAGAPPAGDVDDNLKPKISKNSREFGLRPRGVSCSRTVGTGDDTAKKYTFVPVLGATTFLTAAYALGATLNIDGTTWTIINRFPEDYN